MVGGFHPGHEQKRQLYEMLRSSCTVAFYGKFMGQIYCINHREGTGILALWSCMPCRVAAAGVKFSL
jgi:hypothetical protein